MTDVMGRPMLSLSDILLPWICGGFFVFLGGGWGAAASQEKGAESTAPCIRQYNNWFGTVTTAEFESFILHTCDWNSQKNSQIDIS